MKELVVPSKFNNKKLQSFLMHNFPSLTNSLFYKTLRKKDIKINNIRISENILLHTNDNVKVYISDELLLPNTQIKINIIYEDNNILIANKPEQIEVTGDSGLTCLLKKQHNFKFLEPCHRLDRNTTGLTLFAKNQEALNILLNKFKNAKFSLPMQQLFPKKCCLHLVLYFCFYYFIIYFSFRQLGY